MGACRSVPRVLKESPLTAEPKRFQVLRGCLRFVENCRRSHVCPMSTRAACVDSTPVNDKSRDLSYGRRSAPARSRSSAAGTCPMSTYDRERPSRRDRSARQGVQEFPCGIGGGRRADAGTGQTRRDRIFHQLPARRSHGQLLRRQSPGVRRVRGQGDGVGQRRGAPRRGTVRVRDCQARGQGSGRARRRCGRVRGPLTTSGARRWCAFDRLTPNIVEVIVRAPAAARHFEPGSFFGLQNYEALGRVAGESRLMMRVSPHRGVGR